MTDGAERAAARAFFGRRKGHPLRVGQQRLFDTLLPRLALGLEAPPPADLRGLFPRPVEAVRLEIGFGGGEHLLAQARANPSTGFIGCEPFVNGMATALAALDAAPMPNVRLHHADAAELLAFLPPCSLARVDLLYPDPWPKRRHWKRRFVQADRIAALARVLRRGAEFRFATDVPDYAAWTLCLLSRSEHFAWTAERADDWRRPPSDHVATRYERKAVAAGRAPTYLRFRRL